MKLAQVKQLKPANQLPMIAECIIDDLKQEGFEAKLKANKNWKKLRIVPVGQLSKEDQAKFDEAKNRIQMPYLEQYIETLREVRKSAL